jgi:hypothetical protein
MRAIDCARAYRERGWKPVPIPHREKSPGFKGWQEFDPPESEFDSHFHPDPLNIGVRLGDPSGGLVDVDLDCQEAITLAPEILPASAIFGRASKPGSHRIYLADPCPKTAQFKDPDGPMLVELRSTGAQTVFPGSTHPSGEPIVWENNEVPLHVSAPDLQRAVQRLASAALLARRWPLQGSRQDAALALSGGLLEAGWTVTDVQNFVRAVARAAGDEEADKRTECAVGTAAKLAESAPVTGWTRLEEMVDKKSVEKVRKWLDVRSTKPARTRRARTAFVTMPVRSSPVRDVPTIAIEADEKRVNDEAIVALARNPNIYQRGGNLVRVMREESPLSGVVRSPAALRIDLVPLPSLREELASCALWTAVEGLSTTGDLQHPPGWSVKAISARGNWEGIRVLEGVVRSPVLRPDGTVLDVPGYDAATGLLYQPNAEFPSIKSEPTHADALLARDELLEVASDFPFASEAARSGWVSAVLTLLARFAFAGPAPMFVFDASTAGSGKGLLAQTIPCMAEGHPAAQTPQPENESEERKQITAAAIAGERIVFFDNLTRPLGSGALEAVLTTTRWSDRILGESKRFEGDVLTVWMATGNNVAYRSVDTLRRIVPIRLESSEEHPEMRTSFKHPKLLEWVLENRGRLVTAALTMLRAYQVAGRPDVGLTGLGSFEGWSALVRATVVWCDLPDPDTARLATMAFADTEAAALMDFLEGWDEMCKGPAGTPDGCLAASAINELAADEAQARGEYGRLARPLKYPRLREALATLVPMPHGQLPTVSRLGKKLSSIRGRVVGGKKLDHTLRRGNNLWKVTDLGRQPAGGSPAGAALPVMPAGDAEPVKGASGAASATPSGSAAKAGELATVRQPLPVLRSREVSLAMAELTDKTLDEQFASEPPWEGRASRLAQETARAVACKPEKTMSEVAGVMTPATRTTKHMENRIMDDNKIESGIGKDQTRGSATPLDQAITGLQELVELLREHPGAFIRFLNQRLPQGAVTMPAS